MQGDQGELPLDASTQFVSGQQGLLYFGGGSGKHVPLDSGWPDEGRGAIRAYSPLPQVYETLAELSLADSPVKRQGPSGPPLGAFLQQGCLDAGPPDVPAGSRAFRTSELEHANVELSRRVEELQVGDVGQHQLRNT